MIASVLIPNPFGWSCHRGRCPGAEQKPTCFPRVAHSLKPRLLPSTAGPSCALIACFIITV